MQSVNFPISFPGHAYKVLVGSKPGTTYRYGALDHALNPLASDFETLEGLAELVVAELLQLGDLPNTEAVPDSYCDLNSEDWEELNRIIKMHAQRSGAAWEVQ